MTNLLRGVTQMLIYSRPSPCLANVGHLFDPNSNNTPSNKESPYKLNFLHNGPKMLDRDPTLHCVGQVMSYLEHQMQLAGHSTVKYLPSHCFTGSYTAPSCAKLGGSTTSNITHTRLSSGRDSNTN